MANNSQRAKRKRQRQNQKAKKQTTVVAANPNKGSRSSRGRSAGFALMKSVVDLADPFSTAGPQRFPDGSSGNAIPYRARYFSTISIGQDSAVTTNYRGAHMFLPRLNTPFYNPTYTATNQLPITAWADSTEDFSDYSTLAAAAETYRITSWGIRVYSVGPPLTSSGVCIVRTINMQDPTTDLSGPNAVAQDRVEYAIQPGMDFFWVSKPTDPSTRLFRLISTTSADNLDEWTIPQVHVETTSADTQIRVEIVMNIEILATPGGILSRLVIPGPERSEGWMSTLSHLYRNISSHVPNALHQSTVPLVGELKKRGVDFLSSRMNEMLSRQLGGGSNLLLKYPGWG